jgi:hypothetical protein
VSYVVGGLPNSPLYILQNRQERPENILLIVPAICRCRDLLHLIGPVPLHKSGYQYCIVSRRKVPNSCQSGQTHATITTIISNTIT